MAGARFSGPIEPMTRCNMRQLGVRLLDVACHHCHRETILDAAPGRIASRCLHGLQEKTCAQEKLP
jgi:hypothetical protein